MLDLFRRQKKHLKLTLWLVIITLAAGMAVFFVPWMDSGSATDPNVVAVVGDKTITVGEFQRLYQVYLNDLQRANNYKLTPEMLKLFKVEQVVLDNLIQDRVLLLEAERLGLGVTPEEVAAWIQKSPEFQEEGRFIGKERYLQVLSFNNVSPQEFEERVRIELLKDKLGHILTTTVSVSPDEVRQEFLDRNEKIAIDYVLFNSDDYLAGIPVDEAALRQHFDKNRDRYRVPEQRRLKYLLFDEASMLKEVEATEQEARAYYDANPPEEEAKVAHILISVPQGATKEQEAAAEAKAKEIAARAKKGEDFAALARQYSDDPGSKEQGGELPYSTPSAYVPEFSAVAFELKPGEISDPVRTPYGFHIIKGIAKRRATFEEMKSGILNNIRFDKASDLAERKAGRAAALLRRSRDIAKVAAEFGLKVQETQLFRAGQSLTEPAGSRDLVERAFDLKAVGDVTTAVKTTAGYVVAQLAEIKPPYLPELAEVKGQVEQDYRQERAVELAKARAEEFMRAVKAEGGLERAAEKAKLKVNRTQEFTRREQVDATIGSGQQLKARAFALKAGEAGGPIKIDGKFVVFSVRSRPPLDEAKFEQEKETLRQELLAEKRNAFVQAYIRSSIKRLEKENRLTVNQDLIRRFAG